MTKKRCTDCKHTKGIGYDFWCGEGHTEYEVFGAETNCPYYEYHDWSKGTPSRTEKRFKLEDIGFVYDNGTLIGMKEIVECLNALHEEKEYWKKRALLLENKYNKGDSIEWLRNNTVWEQMPTNQKTYTRTDIK